MPNAFLFYKKYDKTETPVPFSQIDEEICKFFEVIPDEKRYYYGWYDNIGDLASQGLSFDEILKYLNKIKTQPKFIDESWQDVIDKTIQITIWMNEHYGSKSWYVPKTF